jgi:hypothetical protein
MNRELQHDHRVFLLRKRLQTKVLLLFSPFSERRFPVILRQQLSFLKENSTFFHYKDKLVNAV